MVNLRKVKMVVMKFSYQTMLIAFYECNSQAHRMAPKGRCKARK